MNKYEKYLDMVDFVNNVLTSSNYTIEKHNNKKKVVLYEKLVVLLLNRINKKSKDPKEKENLINHFITDINLLIKKKTNTTNSGYSDSDIEFLNQFDTFDLNQKEADAVGKIDEYNDWIRYILYLHTNESKIVHEKVEEEMENVNNIYSPRLLYSFFLKHKKKQSKN